MQDGTNAQDADGLFRTARQHAEAGQFQEALNLLSGLLRQTPAHVEARLLAAQILVRHGQTQDALRALSQGLDLLPGHPQLKAALADLQTPSAPAPAQPQSLQTIFPGVTFGSGVQVLGLAGVAIGAGSCIGEHSWLNVCLRDNVKRLVLGRCVLIGRGSMISTGGNLEIGDYALFGPRVTVVDANHGIDDIYTPYMVQRPTLGRRLLIEENCWLGAGATVSGNLTIGRGSVVGANAVVLKDVPPFCIVGGNPAQILKLYDPVRKAWVRIASEADREAVLRAREQQPLPSRQEYAAILRQNARLERVDPLVAGGESI